MIRPMREEDLKQAADLEKKVFFFALVGKNFA